MSDVLCEVLIAEIRNEADGIRSYRLESLDGLPLVGAEPGAHVDVYIPSGLIRQYSLCHEPSASDGYLIAVKRELASRGGSRWLHDEARAGDRLVIGKPRSLLAVASNASHHVLVAGGIGITPLYSMALHFLSQNLSFELHYFARSPEQAAFRAILGGAAFDGRVRFHYGVAPNDLSGKLDAVLAGRPAGSHLYMCGPTPFMDAVHAKAAAWWPPDAIHLERFSADTTVAENAGAFQIVLASTGDVIDIPVDRGILEILIAQGRRIEHSCEQGFCGSCITAVLEGDVDHRDTFLTEEELASGKWIMPCVSRARSARLVLDI